VFDDQALVNPEDVHNRTASVVGISRVLLAVVVHNHQVTFGDHPLDLATEVCFIDASRKPCDERRTAVCATGVVFDVLIS
jgi:hypothetical protein